MKAERLTDAKIKRAGAPRKKGGRVAYRDLTTPGLVLRVNDKGEKRWMVHFRVNGSGDRFNRKWAIGEYPGTSLEEARSWAGWARDHAKNGRDPRQVAEAERAEREREALAASQTAFGHIADQYVEAMKAGKLTGGKKRPVAPETAKARESQLKRIRGHLGDRPIGAITTAEIARMLNAIEQQRGGPVDRCLQLTRLVFKFARARGLFAGPLPTDGLQPRQQHEKKARALADHELRAMWAACEAYGYPFGPATKLLMLTGQRRDEIGAARWADVDWDNRLLIIRAEHVKNRAGDHEVPLTATALEVLRSARQEQQEWGIESAYVFSTNETSPASGWSKAGPRLRKYMRVVLAELSADEQHAALLKGPLKEDNQQRKAAAAAKLEAVTLAPWRFHDLRHTVVTRMRDGDENDEGETTYAVPLDVIQQVVNHRITAGVTDAYDHGDIEKRYRLRKREALAWWEAKLMGIVSEAKTSRENVVKIEAQKRAKNAHTKT